MLNLTYPCRSQKNLLRNIYSPSRDTSGPCSRVCCRSSVYYDGYSYGGRGPRRASYSRKTSLRSARNGLATSSKNYNGSLLYDSVRDIRGAPYRRNGLSCRKMTYKGACRVQKRKTCLLSFLHTIGRYYTQPLAIQYVLSRLALYSQRATSCYLNWVDKGIAEF